jgi:hypothetical protein
VIHSAFSSLSQPTTTRIQTVPNPNNGNFTIHSEECQSYTLSTMQGQTVAQGTLQVGNNIIQLSLPDGIYVLTLEKNNIKQRLQIRTE